MTRPVVEAGDADVARLQAAAKSLKARGVLEPVTVGYVHDVYKPPPSTGLHLPENFVPTHQTGGLRGFPARDFFANHGTPVYPPEGGVLVWPHLIAWDETKRVGGWTCYWQGDSGDTYFLTHFAALIRAGRYAKSTVIGSVAEVPHGWWQSHIHEGKHKGRYNPPV